MNTVIASTQTAPVPDASLRLRTWALGLLLAAWGLWMAARPATAGEKLDPAEVADALSQAYADVAAGIGPSVVGIRSEVRPDVAASDLDEFGGEGDDDDNGGGTDLDELRRFFGLPSPYGQRGPQFRRFNSPAPRRSAGMGSGVIIDAAGHILTNNHVVKGADKLEVILSDDSRANATVVGTDPETDIAVIKLTDYKGTIKPATLGDSDKVRVGNIVIAIGAPFSQIHSFTSGIVSGKSRQLGAASYENYIQTDAAINPGNSGGPLVNLKGEVIGINTIISTRSGASAGVGFAVPSNLVKSVVRQLIDKGSVTRGWLGIEMRSLEPAMREALGTPEGGVLINKVIEGSPSSKAGLQRGDVLLKFNGKPIKGSNELLMNVAEVEPGTEVKIDLIRNAKPMTVTVKLDRRPANLASLDDRGQSDSTAPSMETAKSERLGLTVRALRPNDSRQPNGRKAYGEEKGVVITNVVKDGPAYEAGLRPRMLIIQLNVTDVPDIESFKKADAALGNAPAVRALVCPAGSEPTYIAITLPPKP